MGKVHRIKRAFKKLRAQKPMPEGRHRLGPTNVSVCTRYDGSQFIMTNGWYRGYYPLLKKLEKEYDSHAV